MSSESVIIKGHKLFRQSNGLYRNEYGKTFSYERDTDRLYEERSPGKWFLLRGRTEVQREETPKPKSNLRF